jgi:nanoRNase/pAp phosphatase (c-di-AMP/oligoRNAs hydrolase)
VQQIQVFDHHVDQTSDIVDAEVIVEAVGSVTTLIVERLMLAGVAVVRLHSYPSARCSSVVTSSLRSAWC